LASSLFGAIYIYHDILLVETIPQAADRGERGFAPPDLLERAFATPPRPLDPGLPEIEKVPSERGGTGGQTGPYMLQQRAAVAHKML